MDAELAVADVVGEIGVQHAVGTAGAAAQTVVVELDDIGERLEHAAHGEVGPLHVAQVARILHRDRPAWPARRR